MFLGKLGTFYVN